MGRLISRIHKFIPRELMYKLNEVCHDHTARHNNAKADRIIELLNEFNVKYVPIGAGTNRYCARIDGYIFKFAMDVDGINDNLLEFSMSEELQPLVTKTYECNGLIVVAEYVTVIKKEEFLANKETIREILSTLADRYLFDDVGVTTKNYLNWGYRESGELVILDYGYAYRVTGNEMKCGCPIDETHKCEGYLDYTPDFTALKCPECGRKYNIGDIRRRIDKDYEHIMLEKTKASAYCLTGPYLDIDDDTTAEEITTTGKEDESTMATRDLTPEEREEMYNDLVMNYSTMPKHTPPQLSEDVTDCDDEYDDIIDDEETEEVEEPEAVTLPYVKATLFGNIPCLFTDDRIDPNYLPDTVSKYDIRHDEDDEDVPVSLEHHVIRDFYGTIITLAELDLGEDNVVEIDDAVFRIHYGEEMYLKDFIASAGDTWCKEVVDISDGGEPVEHDIDEIMFGDVTFDDDDDITVDVDSEVGGLVIDISSASDDEDDDDCYDDDDEDDDDEFIIDPEDVDGEVYLDEGDDDYDDGHLPTQEELEMATKILENTNFINSTDTTTVTVQSGDSEATVTLNEGETATVINGDDGITVEVDSGVDEDLSDSELRALADELVERMSDDEDPLKVDPDVIAEALAEEEDEANRKRNAQYKRNR